MEWFNWPLFIHTILLGVWVGLGTNVYLGFAVISAVFVIGTLIKK